MLVFQWEQTQDALKLTAQRNIYGLHMPARRLMERRIVMESHLPAHMHPLGARQANLAMDILMGRDETVDLADVFDGAYARHCAFLFISSVYTYRGGNARACRQQEGDGEEIEALANHLPMTSCVGHSSITESDPPTCLLRPLLVYDRCL